MTSIEVWDGASRLLPPNSERHVLPKTAARKRPIGPGRSKVFLSRNGKLNSNPNKRNLGVSSKFQGTDSGNQKTEHICSVFLSTQRDYFFWKNARLNASAFLSNEILKFSCTPCMLQSSPANEIETTFFLRTFLKSAKIGIEPPQ
jgi:hypothetical protein